MSTSPLQEDTLLQLDPFDTRPRAILRREASLGRRREASGQALPIPDARRPRARHARSDAPHRRRRLPGPLPSHRRSSPASAVAPGEVEPAAGERRVHGARATPTTSGPTRRASRSAGTRRSSASMVSLMTALWFAHLQAPDRVSVKPHASPVLHAINVLLGRLDPSYLSTCGSSAACSPTRRGRRTPTRSTTRRGRSASGRRRRSGGRWRTATWPGTSRCRSAGARSRCSATPSSTRARFGRPSPTRWCRAWARSCGSSTSTASRSTASSRTSRRGAWPTCSRPPAGTWRR